MAVSRRSNFGYIPSRGRGKLKPGFVDYSKVIGDTFNLDSPIEQRKVKESEYAENIENSPIEVDVAKVQDNLEGGLSNYLMQMKMDASEGARLVRDNKVGSAKYDDGQQMMKKARSNMANLDKQFSALQAISLEDIENIQKDMYSEGNKVDNAFDTMSLLSKGQLGPERIYYKDGQIYIKNGGADNKDVAFSDLKLRFLKDSKSMGDVTSTYTNLFNNATKTGRRYNDSLDSVSINNILENANSQGRRSLAFDWKLPFNQVDEAGNITPSQLSYANSEEAKAVARSLGISEENISNGNYTEWMRDVNNDDLLQKELLNYYNGKFRTAVNGAADVYDQKIQAANQQRIAEIQENKKTTGTPKLADLRYKAYETLLSDTDTIMSKKEGFGEVGSPEYTREFMEELGSKAGAGGKLALKTEEATLNDIFGSKEKNSSIKTNIDDRLSDREDFTSGQVNLFNNILFNYSDDKLQRSMNKNEISSLLRLVPGSEPKAYTTTAKMDAMIEELNLDDAYEGGIESIKTTKFYNAAGLRKAFQRMILHSVTQGSTVDNPSHVFKYTVDSKGNLTVTGIPGVPTGETERKEFINNMVIAGILPNKVAETIGAGAYNF